MTSWIRIKYIINAVVVHYLVFNDIMSAVKLASFNSYYIYVLPSFYVFTLVCII